MTQHYQSEKGSYVLTSERHGRYQLYRLQYVNDADGQSEQLSSIGTKVLSGHLIPTHADALQGIRRHCAMLGIPNAKRLSENE